ncbi:MAG TPA: hypothetical protein VFW30_06670 [Bryocella sp.]|nr:hypothetical protein [Bryocella sp.]
MVRLLTGVLSLVLFAVHGQAQTYPLQVPESAISNAYVLHAKNWPSDLGLPNPAIIRTNAGERWASIETARGVYSPTFGNLFTSGTGWVDTAERHGTELIYTFNTVPQWAVQASGAEPAKRAPYDIDAKDERCVAPLDGEVSAEGNCIWKEWVTSLMQKNCRVGARPATPLRGRCRIRNFEAWNEFNASNFWDDSLAHLAKMANAMAVIVRAYCGDCRVIGGSTSAGGVGRSGDGPAGSGSFDLALGEFLDAWHAIPNASLPDVVSFHAYPSRTNISYPPFPETNVSLNDARCSAANVPNVSCRWAIVDQPSAVRSVLAARAYLPRNLPIWNTESGWNGNRTLLHGVNAAGFADVETDHLRQAFLARETILLANAGIAVNLWYEADHQCDGTLYGFGLPSASAEMWQCHSDPGIPKGLTPAGRALNTVYSWLHGASFMAACRSSGTVWWCSLRGRDFGDGAIAWTTSIKGMESATVIPAQYHYGHTLDGETVTLRRGEHPVLEMRPRLFDNTR